MAKRRYISPDGEDITEQFLAIINSIIEEEGTDCETQIDPMRPGYGALDAVGNLYKTADVRSFERAIDFSNMVDKRIIYVGEIEGDTGASIEAMIRFWNNYDEQNGTPVEDRQPIKLYIDSPGGCLTSAFTAIDAIRLSKTPIWTVNVGCAYSAGFYILLVGHKRFAYPLSSCLYHEGSANMGGDANKFQNFADFYKVQRKMLKELVLKHTNIPEKEYDSHIKDDWWLTAQESLDLGVVDEITREFI